MHINSFYSITPTSTIIKHKSIELPFIYDKLKCKVFNYNKKAIYSMVILLLCAFHRTSALAVAHTAPVWSMRFFSHWCGRCNFFRTTPHRSDFFSHWCSRCDFFFSHWCSRCKFSFYPCCQSAAKSQ